LVVHAPLTGTQLVGGGAHEPAVQALLRHAALLVL